MTKTNFTKVEEVLDEGLRQMTVQHLHALADSLSSIEAEGVEKSNVTAQKKLIAVLKFELNWMETHAISLEKKIGIKKSEIKQLIEKSPPFDKDDFEKIKIIKDKIEVLKKEMQKKPVSNDQLVEKERKKHINKRFNTNDKWLPLH